MSELEYTAVPRDEEERHEDLTKSMGRRSWYNCTTSMLGRLVCSTLLFGMGFGAGWEWATLPMMSQSQSQSQTFIPASKCTFGLRAENILTDYLQFR